MVTAFNSGEISRMYAKQLHFRPKIPNDVALRLQECSGCELRFFEPAFLADESLYDRLQELPAYYMPEKAEFRLALKHLPAGSRILEVGAGAGEFGTMIGTGEYVGLELNSRAATLARLKGLDVRLESLREHLERGGVASYDVVCAFQVLEHVQDPRGLIEEMLSALRERGKIIVSVPNDESFVSLERNDLLNMPPHHQTRWRAQCFAHFGDIFPLKLVHLEREILADYHVKAYLRTVVAEAIDRLLHRKRMELDRFHGSFLIRKFSGLVCVPLCFGLSDPLVRPIGQALTAIFMKIDAKRFVS